MWQGLDVLVVWFRVVELSWWLWREEEVFVCWSYFGLAQQLPQQQRQQQGLSPFLSIRSALLFAPSFMTIESNTIFVFSFLCWRLPKTKSKASLNIPSNDHNASWHLQNIILYIVLPCKHFVVFLVFIGLFLWFPLCSEGNVIEWSSPGIRLYLKWANIYISDLEKGVLLICYYHLYFFSIYLFFFVELCDICSEPMSLSNGSLAVSNDDEWQSLDMSPNVIQKIHKVFIQNLFTRISIHDNHIKVELLERIDIKSHDTFAQGHFAVNATSLSHLDKSRHYVFDGRTQITLEMSIHFRQLSLSCYFHLSFCNKWIYN